jgi:hypothetical protein
MEKGHQSPPAEGGGNKYLLINGATGVLVGAYETKERALLWRDLKGIEHGAYGYHIRTIGIEEEKT